MSKMIKFTQSGFYNIRGNPTDVKHMEFPLVEDWKHGSDGIGYVTVDGSHQPGFPTRNIRVKCDQGAFTLVKEGKSAKVADETDEQIIERTRKRFDILEDMTQAVKEGTVRAMIVTGPPGVGKSFGVDKVLHKEDLFNLMGQRKPKYEVVKGAMSAIGLYCKLYEYADKGNVVVFDDCDSVLQDELSLNILKAALDSKQTRKICWNTDSYKLRNEGVPDEFEFKGSAIFITNIKFDNIKSKKLKDHLDAVQSRCHYLDLTLDTMRDKLLRIKQIAGTGALFQDYDFDGHKQQEILDFLTTNCEKLNEVSLRMALKVADLRNVSKNNWRSMAEVTCMKRRAA